MKMPKGYTIPSPYAPDVCTLRKSEIGGKRIERKEGRRGP
jgi:hypothetical protein